MDRIFDFGIRLDSEMEAYQHTVRCDELAPSGHEYLFRFLSCELGTFRELAEQYMHDLVAGNCSGEPVPDGKDGLYRAAKAIHPLFKNRDDARGLILRSILECARAAHSLPEVLVALSASSAFKRERDYWTDETKTPEDPRRGSVYSLQKAQDRINMMITILFDESGILSARTPAEREAIYAAFFARPGDSEKISVTTGMSISPSPLARFLQAWSDFLPEGAESAAQDLEQAGSDGISPRWLSLLDTVEDRTIPSILLKYSVQTLEDIFDTELYEMIENHTKISRCETCGRFFVIEPENAEYCTIDENGMNCLRTYREGVTKEMYLRAYKTHNQRLSRGRATEMEFRAWKAEALKAREDVLLRKISMAEYNTILTDKKSEHRKLSRMGD